MINVPSVFYRKTNFHKKNIQLKRYRVSLKTLLGILLFASPIFNNNAFAQATAPPNINGNIPINATNQAGSAVNTRNPVTISGLGLNQGVTFTFNGTVTDVPSVLTSHWQSGITFTSATILQTQVDDIVVPEGDFATYTLTFSEAVNGLSFRVDDINFADGFTLSAFDENNNQIALSNANIAGIGTAVTSTQSGNDLAIVNPNNNSIAGQIFFDFTSSINTRISRVRFDRLGKVGSNAVPATNVVNSGNVTLFFQNFLYASIADLRTVKTLNSGDNNPDVGDTVSYRINVSNNGPNQASGTNLTDVLPSGLTFLSAVPSQGNYNSASGLWNIGTLANGVSASLIINATVNAGQGGRAITNVTSVADSVQTDFSTSGDDLNETISISALVDLSITKTNTPGVNGNIDQNDDSLISGATTRYVITVSNQGPDAAIGAIVRDVIGTGLTCNSANAVTIVGDAVPSGNFTIADLTGAGITLGTLANGQSVTLSYDCVVN